MAIGTWTVYMNPRPPTPEPVPEVPPTVEKPPPSPQPSPQPVVPQTGKPMVSLLGRTDFRTAATLTYIFFMQF